MTRVVVAGLALFATLALAAEPKAVEPPKAAVKTRPPLAVLYFDINHNDPKVAVLKKGLAQMLITDLTDHPACTVVERDRLEAVMGELKLQQTDAIDKATAQKIGKLVGAKYQIMGNISEVVGTTKVLFEARLVKVETGVNLGSVRAIGTVEDLLEAEAKLVDAMGSAVSRAEASSEEIPKPKKLGTKLKLETAIKYAEALDAIDRKDKKTAQVKLEAVKKEQPDFVLASLDLDRLVK